MITVPQALPTCPLPMNVTPWAVKDPSPISQVGGGVAEVDEPTIILQVEGMATGWSILFVTLFVTNSVAQTLTLNMNHSKENRR